VVEDEAIIALAIQDMLEQLGCMAVGPALTLQAGKQLAAVEEIDAAVLDINLSGDSSHAVAQTLRDRVIPFCFSTGYGSADVPRDFVDVPVLKKPYTCESLAAVLAQLLS